MSVNAPPLMLGDEISRTPPSKVGSVLKKLRIVICGVALLTVMIGVSRLLSLTPTGSSTNASLGAVSGVVVLVVHNGAPPWALVAVHPDGKAGATTPSKFSLNDPHGVGLGVTPGVNVGVGGGDGVTLGVTDGNGLGE